MRDAVSTRNHLLRALTRQEQELLEPDFETVKLGYKSSLHEPTEHTPWVHFPESGVLSLLTVLNDGTSVELGHVGNEGMVDISVFLGVIASESRTIVQVPGSARRMPAARFREHLDAMPAMRHLIGAYVLEFFTMVAQTTACNRRHRLDQRFARWILMTHDRVGRAWFPITHEFLGDMLGAPRPKVSLVASRYQDNGLIRYERGTMAILDVPGVQARTCECYALIRNRFLRFEARPMSDFESHRPRLRLER